MEYLIGCADTAFITNNACSENCNTKWKRGYIKHCSPPMWLCGTCRDHVRNAHPPTHNSEGRTIRTPPPWGFQMGSIPFQIPHSNCSSPWGHWSEAILTNASYFFGFIVQNIYICLLPTIRSYKRLALITARRLCCAYSATGKSEFNNKTIIFWVCPCVY